MRFFHIKKLRIKIGITYIELKYYRSNQTIGWGTLLHAFLLASKSVVANDSLVDFFLSLHELSKDTNVVMFVLLEIESEPLGKPDL